MDKEELDDLLKQYNNPNFIPGIYNYCDRWCERCSFTSRCANYSVPLTGKPKSDKDPGKKEFWEELADIFKVTAELINHIAEKEGIDLTKAAAETMGEREAKKAEKRALPLVKLANQYGREIHEWINNHIDNLQQKSPASKENLSQNLNVNDALEIIQWYQFLIPAKIERAFGSLEDEKEDGLPAFDSSGSAKIALISTERSMNAWALIFENFEDYQDDILAFLKTLEQIKNGIKNSFPNAESFIRPGLDEK
jgi:hypothetical protein